MKNGGQRWILALVLGGFGLTRPACSRDRARGADRVCTEFDHSHSAFSAVLGRYVDRGRVDYRALGTSGREQLRAYLRGLEAVCSEHYAQWSRDQKLAFWINAYNAYTLKLIIDEAPKESIRSIGLLPGAAWRKKFIPLAQLRGEEVSLNEIEHDILRKELFDPRIHFAINCASNGCPLLESEAFEGSALDDRLDTATERFINDPSKNQIDAEDGKIELSRIFKWFREDFERDGRSLGDFVATYAKAEERIDGATEIDFLDYDWKLNKR